MRLRIVGIVVAAAAVGCSSGGDDPVAAPSSSAPAATSSAPASPTPTPTPNLPSGCDSLLPFTDMDQALGRPLFGETRSVRGVAQPSIGRTARLTCQYGLPASGRGAAPVEVGVSTYVDEKSATDRVAATVAGIRTGGGASSQSQVTVAGLPATVVGNRSSFTCVLAKGDRTIAVTVQRSTRGQPDRSAIRIAEKIVANWAE